MIENDRSWQRTLNVGDDEVRFHDVGTGPPLIMSQAFGPLPGTTAWLTYSRVLSALSAHFRCIVIDHPNFGRSSPKVFHEPFHDVCARNAFAIMDNLGIGAASHLGVSMGATVAIDMALAQPDRVNKLVLGSCHASSGGDPYALSPFPSEGMRLWTENQGGGPDRDAIRRLLRALVFDPEHISEELVQEMYLLRLQEPAHADAMNASTPAPHSNLGDLHKIDVPTLIVHGRHDRLVPVEQALLLTGYLTTAELVILNRCGHWPPFERPDAYLATVLPFLLAPT
ncbi:alpha/beta fold hydrolase [Rhodococcus fascians]|nr:alpha/beta fold hydrolase [Rhodococcus fascians]MBY4399029.1 alpha/beta fold hydrolase [Rhodococcus fascians]MBY4408567.1 alpha/beta fold hydrolase [Rhodococcus fascians]MBY4423606.1 alpha/beta fold hydrolase [Rhodococcus fascians]MBY4462870.1 alpha/beta fold hydrolase [Rhodococcus fascians]